MPLSVVYLIRMGVIDHGKICPTDGLDNRFSPDIHILNWLDPYFTFSFWEKL